MKATELMIGDWVFSLTKKPLRICGIEPREGSALPCTFLVNAYGNDLTYIHLGKMEIEPIPLTPEILEKNEFAFSGNNDTMYGGYYLHNQSTFAIKVFNRCFVGMCMGEDLEFQYVHELQHALRLCGLNDLADNFEI